MEEKLPLVTVVTPTFNLIKDGRENVFMDCINSVREQTYGNIEHIFIDNASDDGTIELLTEHGLTFFSEPDTGIFNAFNKGVQRANGKYVIFLGTDDYYHSKFGIEMSVRALESETADFSYAEALFIMRNVPTKVFEVNLFNTFKVIPYSHQTVMCRRDVLLETPFNESYKISGDVEWHFRMMLKRYKLVCVNLNFVYNRFTGTTGANYEPASKETDRMYRETYHDIYPFSDEELHEMSFYRLFPKKLDEYLSTYFDDPEEYMRRAQEYNTTQEEIKQHKLTANLIQRSRELNGNIVAKIEREINISHINQFLYPKLDDDSQKIFLDFFLKRFGGLKTVDESEEKYLDELFDKANEMANVRETIDTPIDITYNAMDLKYISLTPINLQNLTREQQLSYYFDIVHTFFMNEYDLEGFRPQDGEAILDCGAFSGDTALMFSALYPNSPIYSFEFLDVCLECLNKNIEINNLKNVHPVKAFLSDKTEDTMLKIDDYVKENSIENIGMIKFDIEGAERFALLGAFETIKKYKPILAIPIYHLPDDPAVISEIVGLLGMPAKFQLKWLDKRIYGVDCSLFVKFD